MQFETPQPWSWSEKVHAPLVKQRYMLSKSPVGFFFLFKFEDHTMFVSVMKSFHTFCAHTHKNHVFIYLLIRRNLWFFYVNMCLLKRIPIFVSHITCYNCLSGKSSVPYLAANTLQFNKVVNKNILFSNYKGQFGVTVRFVICVSSGTGSTHKNLPKNRDDVAYVLVGNYYHKLQVFII